MVTSIKTSKLYFSNREKPGGVSPKGEYGKGNLSADQFSMLDTYGPWLIDEMISIIDSDVYWQPLLADKKQVIKDKFSINKESKLEERLTKCGEEPIVVEPEKTKIIL